MGVLLVTLCLALAGNAKAQAQETGKALVKPRPQERLLNYSKPPPEFSAPTQPRMLPRGLGATGMQPVVAFSPPSLALTNMTNPFAALPGSSVAVAGMSAQTAFALTTKMDPLNDALAISVARYEHYLADRSLSPSDRKMYEGLLEDSKQRLADHQTNVQLWANLRQARISRDPEKVARSERQLADYLAAQLGKIRGKTYPPGMSLHDVMKEYGRHKGFGSRQVILTALVLVTLLPLAIIAVRSLRARRMCREECGS